MMTASANSKKDVKRIKQAFSLPLRPAFLG